VGAIEASGDEQPSQPVLEASPLMAKPEYLSVRNFAHFQHYRDRAPLWIKLYNSVMDDEAFIALSDAARGQLIMIWLLASRRDNKIPNDARVVARAIQSSGRVDLERFVSAGFLVPYQSAIDALAGSGQDASKSLADAERPASPHARPRARGEGETELEGEIEEQNAVVRGSAPDAEVAFRTAMGEHITPVLEFLAHRPANARVNWFPELLKIIGPATGVLPEDLAGACSDAQLVDPPATTPVAVRAFARRRMLERLRTSIPVPATRTSTTPAAIDAVAEDEAAWSSALEVVAQLRRGAITSEQFAALPHPLRHAIRAVGGWRVIHEAKAGSLPFLRRDFLSSYHAAEANTPAEAAP
jgi:hypothetical protein